MMQINKQQLLRALVGIAKPSAKALDEFVASFNQWSQAYEINNTKRLVHYLAQVMHESACLRYTTEIASGAAYDTGAKAKALGNTPEKDGDGQKYKGRGYLQLTGRANYEAFTESDLCIEDVVKSPERVAEYPLNQMASMWFWQTNGLNALADLDDGGKAGEDIVRRITQKVNGGQNGIAQRQLYYRRFKKEYGL